MTSAGRGGLFGHLFDNGGAGTGDDAWLQAMLDVEAALARCLERAGLAARGPAIRSPPSRGRTDSTRMTSASRRR